LLPDFTGNIVVLARTPPPLVHARIKFLKTDLANLTQTRLVAKELKNISLAILNAGMGLTDLPNTVRENLPAISMINVISQMEIVRTLLQSEERAALKRVTFVSSDASNMLSSAGEDDFGRLF
jgi:short-subunit dehydrogenase